MANSSLTAMPPEMEMFNFKQRIGETFKDVWYRIWDAQNMSTCKFSTMMLLRNFYIGMFTWYRYILDNITGGSFVAIHSPDAFNATDGLVGSPPIKKMNLK